MKKLILVFFVLAIFVGNAVAGGLNISTCPWEPYVGEGLPEKGFTSAIVKTALERAGYSPVDIKVMPWKRALSQTEKAKYDGIFPAYNSTERRKIFHFSESFARSLNVLCARKDNQTSWTGDVKSLKGLNIGVVAGYANSPEFDAADFFTKDPGSDDLTNLKKLLKKRVDMIVIDKYVAIQKLKSSPTLEGSLKDVKFLEPPLIDQGLYLMVAKQHPQGAEIVKKFNAELAKMESEGVIKEIMFRHGMGQ